MPQVFHSKWNVISRVMIAGLVLLPAAVLGGWFVVMRSPYVTRVGLMPPQPIPFSHQHHAGELGIDCRFCHQSVEEAAFAGMPATEVCMKCHSQIWPREDMLAPVRESYGSGQPLYWIRVHDLPDHTYFDHSIHIAKGVGCSTCHGRVDRMPLMAAAQPMQMQWCLDCHRNPGKHLRPRDDVFDMAWQPPADLLARGSELLTQHRISTTGLTNCTVCHR